MAVKPRQVQEYEDLAAEVQRLDARRPSYAGMTHLGAKPTLPVELERAFGQKVPLGELPYDVAKPAGALAQAGYDLKTLPFYFNPATAIPAALTDISEGLANRDPLQAALGGFGVAGKPFLGLTGKATGLGAAGASALTATEAQGSGPGELAAPFFSKLQKVLEASRTKQAQLDQWLGELKNAGVKPEELDWTLKGLPTDRPLSKDELAGIVGERRVVPEETVLGKAEFPSLDNVLKDLQPQLGALRAEGLEPKILTAPDGSQPQLYFASTRVDDPDGFYSISEIRDMHNGGDTSREVAQAAQLIADAVETGGTEALSSSTRFGEYALPGGENYRELLIKMPEQTDQSFTGGHFDEPNVLAHVRFNDRTIEEPAFVVRNRASGNRGSPVATEEEARARLAGYPDSIRGDLEIVPATRPAKTLFLEELQSDWHRKGRQQKYQRELPPKELKNTVAAASNQADLDDAVALVQEKLKLNEGAGERADEFFKGVRDNRHTPWHKMSADARSAILESYIRQETSGGVPDAPLKGSKWADMAFRRMVKYAADHGYDRVAWITGDQTADRYDLAKRVSHVYLHNPVFQEDGALKNADLIVTGHNGQDLITKNVSLPELSETIGKDAADRLINKPTRVEGRAHVLEGEGLKIGGDWAKNLYDKQLVETAKKLGKKHGATVEKIGINQADQAEAKRELQRMMETWPEEDIGEAAARVLGAVNEGKTLRQAIDAERAYGDPRLATIIDGELASVREGAQEVHSLKLTPSLIKQAREEGFPFFSVAPAAALPVAGRKEEAPVEDFAKGGRVQSDTRTGRLAPEDQDQLARLAGERGLPATEQSAAPVDALSTRDGAFLKTVPEADRPVAEDFLQLLKESKLHRTWSAADLGRLVAPPIALDQYYLLYTDEDNEPDAFVTWAWLTPEAAKGYAERTRKLQPSDWSAGKELWVIDFVAPKGDAAAAAREFRRLRERDGLPVPKGMRAHRPGVVLRKDRKETR